MTTIVGLYAIPDTSFNSYPSLIHDHNIAILRNGKITNYIHLERITRKKYDSDLPVHLDDLARKLHLVETENTCFVFVDHEIGRAFISHSGQIRFEASMAKRLLTKPERGNLYWFGKHPEAWVVNHELAHIYSCVPYYGSFKENSLLIHFDGGASKSNFSAWIFRNNELKLVEAHYKHKWLSSIFNANALVFAMVKAKKIHQNAVPGKFMGLEAFGAYRNEYEAWLRKHHFFEDCWSSKRSFFEAVKKRF